MNILDDKSVNWNRKYIKVCCCIVCQVKRTEIPSVERVSVTPLKPYTHSITPGLPHLHK